MLAQTQDSVFSATLIDMMQIKAIPTEYAGYRFRSRLEARWATFMTHAGIKWQYEHEGYQTSAGWYLPDFRISSEHLARKSTLRGTVLAEVKGAPLRQDEADRIAALVMDDPNVFVWALGDIPDPGKFRPCDDRFVFISGWMGGRSLNAGLGVRGFELMDSGARIQGAVQPWKMDLDFKRSVSPILSGIDCGHRPACKPGTGGIADALRAARSARFGVHE